MEITQDIKKRWERLSSHGDVTAIAKRSGLSQRSISNALKEEKCSDKVFIAIAEFYKEKAAVREKALGLKDEIINHKVASV